MAKHKHIPFVVLGAHDKPNKGMIAYKVKDGNSYWLSIVQLKNDGKYDFGDNYDKDDIEGVYQSILFCDVRSVDAMIKELQMIKKLMEGKDVQGSESRTQVLHKNNPAFRTAYGAHRGRV